MTSNPAAQLKLIPRSKIASLAAATANANSTPGSTDRPVRYTPLAETLDHLAFSPSPSASSSAMSATRRNNSLGSVLRDPVGSMSSSTSTATANRTTGKRALGKSLRRAVGSPPTSSPTSRRSTKMRRSKASLPSKDYRDYDLKPEQAAWLMRESRLTLTCPWNVLDKLRATYPDLHVSVDTSIKTLWNCYRQLEDEALSASLERLGFEPYSWPDPPESVKAVVEEQNVKRAEREEKLEQCRASHREKKKKWLEACAKLEQEERLKKKQRIEAADARGG